MQYIVTNSTLFHGGKKYKRGDIIEMSVNLYGNAVAIHAEPVKPEPVKKKSAPRKPKASAE